MTPRPHIIASLVGSPDELNSIVRDGAKQWADRWFGPAREVDPTIPLWVHGLGLGGAAYQLTEARQLRNAGKGKAIDDIHAELRRLGGLTVYLGGAGTDPRTGRSVDRLIADARTPAAERRLIDEAFDWVKSIGPKTRIGIDASAATPLRSNLHLSMLRAVKEGHDVVIEPMPLRDCPWLADFHACATLEWLAHPDRGEWDAVKPRGELFVLDWDAPITAKRFRKWVDVGLSVACGMEPEELRKLSPQ